MRRPAMSTLAPRLWVVLAAAAWCAVGLAPPHLGAPTLAAASPLPVATMSIEELDVEFFNTWKGLEVRLTDSEHHRRVLSVLSSASSTEATVDDLPGAAEANSWIRVRVTRGKQVYVVRIPYKARAKEGLRPFSAYFTPSAPSRLDVLRSRIDDVGEAVPQHFETARTFISERAQLAAERLRVLYQRSLKAGEEVGRQISGGSGRMWRFLRVDA